MSLAAFFDAMGPYLQGQTSSAQLEQALGPLPGAPADHAFYPWLVAFDQRRILAELYPAVRALVDRTEGLQWDSLVAEYVADHVPDGHSVPQLGEALPDWLAARREHHPEQPEALECLADWRWVRFLAHIAPDTDELGIDERVFLRHYPLDVVAIERHLLRSPAEPLPETAACTWLAYRHSSGTTVHQRPATLTTLAVLAQHQGMSLAGPLADLPPDVLAHEADQLRAAGVLPRAGLTPSGRPAGS
jgi:hypothetical protein